MRVDLRYHVLVYSLNVQHLLLDNSEVFFKLLSLNIQGLILGMCGPVSLLRGRHDRVVAYILGN